MSKTPSEAAVRAANEVINQLLPVTEYSSSTIEGLARLIDEAYGTEEVVEMLRCLLATCEHGGFAEQPNHNCGNPDSSCDMLCLDYARDMQNKHDTLELIKKLKGTDDGKD